MEKQDISIFVLKQDLSESWRLHGKQVSIQEVNKRLKERDTGDVHSNL